MNKLIDSQHNLFTISDEIPTGAGNLPILRRYAGEPEGTWRQALPTGYAYVQQDVTTGRGAQGESIERGYAIHANNRVLGFVVNEPSDEAFREFLKVV